MRNNRFLRICKETLRPTYRTAIWLLKLMLPIMLAVSILSYMGVIEKISDFFTPIFQVIGLSGEASIVFITSMLVNVYSAIGVMAGLTLDTRELVILVTMCLISHNMIIEGKVQQKAGANPIIMTILRLSMSFISAIVLNFIMPEKMGGNLVLGSVGVRPNSLGDVFFQWFNTAYPLVIKVIVVIYFLNLLQAVLKEYKLMSLLQKPLYPLMNLLGLPKSTTLAWIIANTLGLTYGGLAISEEVNRGVITHQESLYLNSSIAITHSLLEHTMLFVAIGIPAMWLIIPRLSLSIVAVWGQHLFTYLRVHKNRKIENKI
ncbi:MAG: nucleoside recognition domain-containing protein [Bacteroidetes bacterium]|nr:nucleoside recognition domain-containing protein [Bacteroidota bacterium]